MVCVVRNACIAVGPSIRAGTWEWRPQPEEAAGFVEETPQTRAVLDAHVVGTVAVTPAGRGAGLIAGP